MKTVAIKGVKDTSGFEDYVASNLVDTAYVQSIIEDNIILTLEDDIDLADEEDRKWIVALISNALVECNELSATLLVE